MKSRLICFLFCLITLKTNPIYAEAYYERWLGLWVGEAQAGHYPDFSWLSNNDIILILPSTNKKLGDFILYADTNWAERRYGGIGPMHVNHNKDIILATDGGCSVSLKLYLDSAKAHLGKTEANKNVYLEVNDNNNCGGMSVRIAGIYKRFSK